LRFELALCNDVVCDTFHVSSTGSDTCTLSDIYGCTASPFSLDTSMTVMTLPPGESTEFVVCATPEVAGVDTCTVTVASDGWGSPMELGVWIEVVVGVEEVVPFRIVSVVPNPFNPTMAVHFTLPAAMPVTAEVFSVAGARVRMLADEERFAAGENRLTWDGLTDKGKPAASGVYFIRMETPLGARVTRAVLLK
jgi:hypothetical protein